MSDDPLARIERLERAVEQLESELEQLRGSRGSATDAALAPPQSCPPADASPWPAPEPPVAPRGQIGVGRARPAIDLDSEQVLKWGGVGLVVLAVGFAVSTAISRGWIGPELQLLGAALVSIGLVVVGLRLQPTRPGWTHALCAAGVAAAFTTVASNLFLERASDWVVFASTVVIGVAGFAVARFAGSQWVASTTVAGGIVGWLVIAAEEPPVIVSVVWCGGVVAIVIVLSLERRWFASRLLAHAAGLFVVLPIASEADRPIERIVVLGVAAVLGASLAWVPSIGDLGSIWQQLEVQLVIALGPWALAVTTLTFDTDDDRVVGWTAVAIAVGVVAIAALVRRSIHPAHLVSLLVSASITLSIGIAVLLTTSAVFVALAVQGAGLVALARASDDNPRVYVNAAILLLIAAVFALVETIAAWSEDARLVDDLAHLVIIAAIGVAGWLTARRIVRLSVAAVVLAMSMIWIGSVLVHLPQGQAAVSITWAVIGTVLLIVGAIEKLPEVGAAGLVVLGVTVAKLLTVDLREVDTLWRAGLFFVVGIGFLRLGFLLPRLTQGRPPTGTTD